MVQNPITNQKPNWDRKTPSASGHRIRSNSAHEINGDSLCSTPENLPSERW